MAELKSVVRPLMSKCDTFALVGRGNKIRYAEVHSCRGGWRVETWGWGAAIKQYAFKMC